MNDLELLDNYKEDSFSNYLEKEYNLTMTDCYNSFNLTPTGCGLTFSAIKFVTYCAARKFRTKNMRKLLKSLELDNADHIMDKCVENIKIKKKDNQEKLKEREIIKEKHRSKKKKKRQTHSTDDSSDEEEKKREKKIEKKRKKKREKNIENKKENKRELKIEKKRENIHKEEYDYIILPYLPTQIQKKKNVTQRTRSERLRRRQRQRETTPKSYSKYVNTSKNVPVYTHEPKDIFTLDIPQTQEEKLIIQSAKESSKSGNEKSNSPKNIFTLIIPKEDIFTLQISDDYTPNMLPPKKYYFEEDTEYSDDSDLEKIN